MKNYTLNDYDAEIFITNYEETDKGIIVNYADNSNKIVKNDDSYRRIIKEMMTKQVLNDKTKKLRKSKMISFWKYIGCLGINILLLATTIFLMFATQLYMISIATLIGEVAFTTIIIYKIIESYNFIKDIDKHIMFIENKETINNAILSDEKVLDNVKKQTKEIATQNKEEPLDINKIHKIKYTELRNLLEYIKSLKQSETNIDFRKSLK